MNTGEIIKYFRLARNMTQEQLAQDAEISFSTLRKYEANERNPKYEQLSKIADMLIYIFSHFITVMIYVEKSFHLHLLF